MRYLFFVLAFIILFSIPVLASNYGITNVYFLANGVIRCSPVSFYKIIQQGTSDAQNITVDHIGDYSSYYANFNNSTGAPGNWTTFSVNPVLVPAPSDTNYTTVNISVPSGQPTGNYSGYIFANSSNTTFGNCTIPFTINVTTVPPPPPPPGGGGGGWGGGLVIISPTVLDTDITIEQDQVQPGERIYATITILKAGGPAGAVNVNLTYFILDQNGNVIDVKFSTVGVENIRSDIYFLRIPSTADLGIYTFKAIAVYGNATDEAQDTFQIVKELPEDEVNLTVRPLTLFVGIQDNIVTLVNSLTERDLLVNITLKPPNGLIAERDSIVIKLTAGEETVLFWPVTATKFGIFTGHFIIKYEDRSIVREFTIRILPPYLYIILLFIIIILILVLLILYRRRERRYERGFQIQRIRRLVAR
jgi:hypothetical protein